MARGTADGMLWQRDRAVCIFLICFEKAPVGGLCIKRVSCGCMGLIFDPQKSGQPVLFKPK